MDMSQDPAVRELRERIAENDRAIVAAVNRRIELVGELRAHKIVRGYSLVDLSRESWLLEHLAESNAGPLSPDGLRSELAKVPVSGYRLEVAKTQRAGLAATK